MSEYRQPAQAESAITKRFVIAVISTYSDNDDEFIAESVADDLRDQGWEPVGVTVHRV